MNKKNSFQEGIGEVALRRGCAFGQSDMRAMLCSPALSLQVCPEEWKAGNLEGKVLYFGYQNNSSFFSVKPQPLVPYTDLKL